MKKHFRALFDLIPQPESARAANERQNLRVASRMIA
jgi:hypothetical protein